MYDDKGNNKELIDSLKNTLKLLINKYKKEKMTELGVYYIESCLKNAKKYLDNFSMEQKDVFISDMKSYAYIKVDKFPNYEIKINSYHEIKNIQSKYLNLFEPLIIFKDSEIVQMFQNEIEGLIQNFYKCKKELEKDLDNMQ